MSVKLVNEIVYDVHVSTMNDGDIAVITKWAPDSSMIGTIVQRYYDALIIVGKPGG